MSFPITADFSGDWEVWSATLPSGDERLEVVAYKTDLIVLGFTGTFPLEMVVIDTLSRTVRSVDNLVEANPWMGCLVITGDALYYFGGIGDDRAMLLDSWKYMVLPSANTTLNPTPSPTVNPAATRTPLDYGPWILGESWMSRSLNSHSCGWDGDDTIFILGGGSVDENGIGVTTNYGLMSFSIQSGDFTDHGTSSLSSWVQAASSTYYEDQLYIILSDSVFGHLNMSSGATDFQSTETVSMNARHSCIATDGEYLYVLGGVPSFGQQYQFRIFKLSTSSWLQDGPDLPFAVAVSGCLVHNGTIYVIGGIDPDVAWP